MAESDKGTFRSFNQNLLIAIVLLSVVITIRLYSTAALTDNWRGFFYSLLHVLIVGAGTFYAIRRR